MNILVTGAAGFIGFHLAKLLLKKNLKVIGIDNVNSYYDVKLKNERLKILKLHKNFIFIKADIGLIKFKKKIQKYKIDIIFHLAAQAGIRYSLEKPEEYLKSNIIGTFNILEFAKKQKIKKIVFASSSSVYGQTSKKKFLENHNTDSPIQFYAATKKSCEVMLRSYSHLYNIDVLVFRLFTVYGPYGRPDMAVFKFVKNIINRNIILLFNNGKHGRDFTFVNDVVNMISKLSLNSKINKKKFEIFNIAAGKKEKLFNLVKVIEKNLKIKAKIKFDALQTGDIKETHANTNKIKKYLGNFKSTSLEDGVSEFIKWYKSFYK